MTSTYVVTFYSFKGGVGRSTLLANVAHALAAQGERVLLWDLDLEAPGLHHFPGLEPPEHHWQSGFLEWLGATPPAPGPGPDQRWPAADWLKTLGDRVYQPQSTPARGQLRVLPAHGTSIDLGRAYAQVDWHGLLVVQPEQGLHLFTRVRDELIARFEPTFLFIDARTGVSDLGGILTGYLADCTVLVGNYSRQSTEGLRMVYVALDRFATERVQSETHRSHKLERVLVASPVPTSPAAQDRGRARWQSGFPGVAPRSQIEVPLVESLLYAEDVLVRSAPSSDAAKAYRAVASTLTSLRQSRERTRPRPSGEIGTERALVARVERLLRLLGFELSAGADVDLLALERNPLRDRAHDVLCVPGTARADAAFRDRLERLRPSGGGPHEALLIVEDARDDARLAARAADVTLRTIAELEAQLVDLSAYAATIRRGFEDSELARGYVAPRFAPGSEALEASIAWVMGQGPQLMLVVGDDGSGKTSFLRRFAYELVDRAARDPATPIPILIQLRDAQAGMTLESLLQQHLREAIGWFGNPDAILYLLHAGRLVLLLDGFDEITGTSYGIGAHEQLRILARPTTTPGAIAAGNRVVITCRTHFFREEEAPQRASDGPPDLRVAAERMNAITVELAPFDGGQIAHFLENKLGRKSAGPALAAIQRNVQVATMAQRPMLLAIMAESAEGLANADDRVTTTSVYERPVEAWLGRPDTGVDRRQRVRLIERLAAALWKLPDNELHLALFAEMLTDLDAAAIDRELRTAPFLSRSPEGGYRFAHPIYLEYCFARHLATQAGLGADELRAALATERLTASFTAMFAELVASDRARGATIARTLRAVVDGPHTAAASDNAARLAAALRDPITAR